MSEINITRAKLIPMDGDNPSTDESTHINVQFNPATLRVTLSNNVNADNRGGNASSNTSAQFVNRGESSLNIELLFDTTVEWTRASNQTVQANSDVRIQTKRIAQAFMDPQDPQTQNPRAPQRCRFQWGRFQFTGVVSDYTETIDFFAPEGIPLRATLALTLKSTYQFDMDETAASAAQRSVPTFGAGGSNVSAAQAAQASGASQRDWRSIADANNLENPRMTPASGLNIPSNPLRGR